jgi:hypothetical protein
MMEQLLSNLRIAAATFGEDSAHFRELKAMVDEYLADPSRSSTKGSTEPDSMGAGQLAPSSSGEETEATPVLRTGRVLNNLTFRPKPKPPT